MNADLFFRKFFIITLPIPPLVLVSDVYTSLISIIGLITLLIASALISGSEVALFGLSAQDIQWLKAQDTFVICVSRLCASLFVLCFSL